MKTIQEFIDFIREQGVVGLAIGFILGGAVSKLVSALVTDIINPVVGLALGAANNLSTMSFHIGSATILLGSFVSSVIDFIIIAMVVYIAAKIIDVGRLDKKKNQQ